MSKRKKEKRPKKSGTQKILELLQDGREHSHTELYRLHCIAHSRVSERRKRGHNIKCEREHETYWYWLEDAA